MSMSFEESLNKLEEILGNLEKGDVTLDESIRLYQEGMLLSKECSEKLQAVEKQIEVITEKNGELITQKADLKEK